MAAWHTGTRGLGSQKGPGGTGPQAARGAWVSFVSFLIIVHIFCGYSQAHSCVPLVLRRGRRDGPGGHGTQGQDRRLYRAAGGARARPGASDGTLACGSVSILPVLETVFTLPLDLILDKFSLVGDGTL